MRLRQLGFEDDATPGASSTAGATATGTVTPADALQRTEQTLAGGYTITVTASNFLLPQWGGSDGGTVQVGKDGKSAVARLRRTGEDSYYDIRYVDGQTFFKRGTCDTWARVPGGGADVLKPFLLTASHVLTTVQDPKFIEADNRLVVDATVDGLGRSLIQMDPKTFALVTIVFGDQPDNAGASRLHVRLLGRGQAAHGGKAIRRRPGPRSRRRAVLNSGL